MAVVFPLSGGQPNLSGSLIREKWDNSWRKRFYSTVTILKVANTDHQAEFQKDGDTIKVQIRPTMVNHNYVKGQNLVYQKPEGSTIDMLIQRGKYNAFNTEDVDVAQSFMDFAPVWLDEAAKQQAIDIDKQFYASIYTDPDSANQGATAGADSGGYNMGTAGAPVAFTPVTSTGLITDLNAVLDEQSVDPEGRFFVIPPWAKRQLKNSDIKFANQTGDDTAVLRNGVLGVIDNTTIIVSRNLPVTGTAPNIGTNCLFGTKQGISFAEQLKKMEHLKAEMSFEERYRQLHIYDWKTFVPKAIGNMFISQA